ncbi:hypothetical protein [Mycobacterium phage SWU1]|uniref:Uncharacterized protein n=1 Tax=Mycobacterium phage SWU1 TaxID=1175504 RepID=I1V1G5_9CAUD|nr:hypothetical protein A321_gp63 [Mycobacterium phage SWU1]AFI24943.1 hypothetical protein [Mycobacterium phage SWU1]
MIIATMIQTGSHMPQEMTVSNRCIAWFVLTGKMVGWGIGGGATGYGDPAYHWG